MSAREKFEELAAEMRGRYAALETVTMTVFVHVAAASTNPAEFMTGVLADTRDNLAAALLRAPPDQQKAAEYALATHDLLRQAAINHLHKYVPSAGRG